MHPLHLVACQGWHLPNEVRIRDQEERDPEERKRDPMRNRHGGNVVILLLKMSQPRSLFGLFKQTIQFLQQINVKNI